MMRKLFAGILFCAIATFWFGCDGSRARASNSEAKSKQVRVVRAEKTVLARTVAVTGTLAADQEVTLALKVAGRVREIAVDLGSHVKRGQVLARLEPTDFDLRVRQSEAALQQARARLGMDAGSNPTAIVPEETALVRQAAAVLEQARLTRERMESLSKQGLISRSQLDDALANFHVAEARYQDAREEVRNRQAVLSQRQAELEIARKQQSDSILTSNMDGAVQERLISAGQFLPAGEAAFRIVSSDPLRLRLAVPEREAVGIRIGQQVSVKIDEDATVYPGKVARVSPAISADNRTLAVEAEIPNQNGQLRPGTFARAEIVVQAQDPAILVPASSITAFAGINKVILVANNITAEKRVRTGRRSGDSVEIVEGISAGDVVVITPGNLVGGESVTPVW